MMHRELSTWVLVLAVLPAAAGVAACTGSLGEAPEAWLITVAGEDAAPGGDAAYGTSWIGVKLPGEAPRNLTTRFSSARQPAVSFDGKRFLFVGREEESGIFRIWEMGVDGSGARSVTAGHGDPADPIYLPDGRVLFSDVPDMEEPSRTFTRSLFACAADGSGVSRITFGHHRDRRPGLLPDGRIRFERALAPPAPAGGPIAMTVRPDGTGIARYPENLSVLSPDPAETGRPPDAGDLDVLEARRVTRRTMPPALTSVVNEYEKTGRILCLDVYASLLRDISSLGEGSIARVRVTDLSRGGSGNAGEATANVLGEAPVHADGSFLVEVPADTPLGLTLISSEGLPLASLRSGIWVRPNETRGCVGCHEAPDVAPENRRPMAVLEEPARLDERIARGGGSHASP